MERNAKPSFWNNFLCSAVERRPARKRKEGTSNLPSQRKERLKKRKGGAEEKNCQGAP